VATSLNPRRSAVIPLVHRQLFKTSRPQWRTTRRRRRSLRLAAVSTGYRFPPRLTESITVLATAFQAADSTNRWTLNLGLTNTPHVCACRCYDATNRESSDRSPQTPLDFASQAQRWRPGTALRQALETPRGPCLNHPAAQPSSARSPSSTSHAFRPDSQFRGLHGSAGAHHHTLWNASKATPDRSNDLILSQSPPHGMCGQ
jgi:hypothetical protein